MRKLAVLLLDDEHGIREDAYMALLDLMPEEDALQLNRVVEVNEGRFYLADGHGLDWLN